MPITTEEYQELKRREEVIDFGGNDGADIEDYQAYARHLELVYDRDINQLKAEYINALADSQRAGAFTSKPKNKQPKVNKVNSMSDENQTIDPILSENLTDVSTADPLIPKARYEVEIVKITQKRNAKDTGNVLNFEFKLTQPTTSVTGEPIPEGRRIFNTISITPTENWSRESIQRALKRFMVCFVKDYKGGIAPLDQWPGLTGTVSIGPAKTTEEYPEPKSEIKAFEPKK